MFSAHNKKRPAASLKEPKEIKRKHSKKTFDLNIFLQEMFGEYYRSRNETHKNIIKSIRKLASHIVNSLVCEDLNGDDISEILLRFILPMMNDSISYETPILDANAKLAQTKTLIKLYFDKIPNFAQVRIDNIIVVLEYDKIHSILTQITEDKSSNNYINFIDTMDTIHTLIEKRSADDMYLPIEYIADFLSISRLLTRREMIYPYLDQLENECQHRAVADNKLDKYNLREDGKLALALNAENIFKRNHLLSSVLYTWAQVNGFKSHSKILRNLTPSQFDTLLSDMSFLKDSAISVGTDTHGAWSHAIQWFIVFEHAKISRFLQHTPDDLYRHAQPAWDRVFDIIPPDDFTSPDHLTNLLTTREAEKRWPLLSGSILRTQAKMHSKYFNYDDYLKKKHEGNYDRGYITTPFNNSST